EVERKLVRLNLGAALLDVIAEDFLQCPVQQVGGGVVLAGEFALGIDLEQDGLTDVDPAFDQMTNVNDRISTPGYSLDFQSARLGRDGSSVPDLPARLDIETRSI